MSARARKRKKAIVRIFQWALIAYFLIAVLHGAIPAIWKHQVEDANGDGPFRVLLFTFLILSFPVLLPLLRQLHFRPPDRALEVHVEPGFVRDWTLRGPPAPESPAL